MTREILVDAGPEEQRVLVLEDGRAVEIQVERSGERVLGSIFLGRVDKVVPGMQAAFVDIGLARHAFLHANDVAGPGLAPPVAGAEREPASRRGAERPIEELVKPGQALPVQVSREPFGGKGARITSQLTLPGRFLVLSPGDSHVGISRRLVDPELRERLRALVDELRGESAWGCIVRTAAASQAEPALRAELEELLAEWQDLQEALRVAKPGALVRAEPPLALRVVRDQLGPSVGRIVVDDPELFERIRSFVVRRDPELAAVVKLHSGGSLLGDLGLEREIDKALRPRVWLRSGGYLVFDQLEALVAIDVNTGKFTGGKRLEDTALKVNLEAAVEIARQLRLRDLGGILIIDFVDMELPEHRERVFQAFAGALAPDRAKSTVLAMSEFCLVQVTRQRQRRSLSRELTEACPDCAGTGRIRSARTVAHEALRRLRGLGHPATGARLRAHPSVVDLIRERLAELSQRGEDLGFQLRLSEEPGFSREHFELSD